MRKNDVLANGSVALRQFSYLAARFVDGDSASEHVLDVDAPLFVRASSAVAFLM